MTNMEPNKGEIVMYQPDETIRLEVRMDGETVWLSQAQMAELFGTKRQAITKHLQNIYDCAELKRDTTSSILELVRKEGIRTVKRKIEYYNLDAIISVGFRVNTKKGIEFRIWANPPITVNACQHNHDRFLIIDDAVYIFGASLKDAGKKLFAYIRMQETSATELLNNIR